RSSPDLRHGWRLAYESPRRRGSSRSLDLCVFFCRVFFRGARSGTGNVRHTITRCIASLNGITRTSDRGVPDERPGSADDRVTGLAQGPADLGAVLRALRLQVQFDLHLREPRPWIGPYMAHVEDVSVHH